MTNAHNEHKEDTLIIGGGTSGPAVDIPAIVAQEEANTVQAEIVEAAFPEHQKVEKSTLPINTPNFELKFGMFKPIPVNTNGTPGSLYKVALPSGTYKNAADKYRGVINEQSSKALLTNAAITRGTEGHASDHFFETLCKDTWTQTPEIEGHVLMASKPPINHTSGMLSGNRAVAHVRSLLNLGYGFMIPLWHSGFWIRIKTPIESELLEFYRELSNSKISLGRQTFGLAFNNNKVYMVDALTEFVKRHITDTNIDIPEDFDLATIIDCRDIDILVWGMAAAIWTNGFGYVRACTVDPSSCNHVVDEMVDVTKMLVVRKEQLTRSQLAHMSKKSPKGITLESLKKYKDDFIVGIDRVIKVNDDISVNLTTPTLYQYIVQGKEWISNIEEEFGRAATMTESERNNYLTQQGLATRLRQYTHYIKSIKAGEAVIEDEDAAKDILNVLSGVDMESSKFMEEIFKYIDDSQVALIAIPGFKCPGCGKEQTEPTDKYYGRLIPVDAFSTFFTLVHQLTEIVSIRQN